MRTINMSLDTISDADKAEEKRWEVSDRPHVCDFDVTAKFAKETEAVSAIEHWFYIELTSD